ncbi:hypothetical protein [Brevundimonas pishanensis]|uniref:hypothetical protein n=1 Tax=Brevundimonas pishanensis TaxID=2896315 RepID=UPI001FA718DF|nr:hypothetical protein [Brevundimonas pishanensis]
MVGSKKENFEIALGTLGLNLMFISFYLVFNLNLVSAIASPALLAIGLALSISFKAFETNSEQNRFINSDNITPKEKMKCSIVLSNGFYLFVYFYNFWNVKGIII